MFPKPFRNFSRGDGMDEYLLSLGLWRKTIPKDDSCLYRAVAEQVFNTQALHEQVKKACQSYIEREGTELANDWLGPLEIKALSLLYKRDFIIYKQPGKEPVNVTNLGFSEQVVLCFSGGNYYDSVYSRPFMENAAVCQSILYELLYENVFGVEHATRKGLEMISTKPSQINKHNSVSMVQDKVTHPCCIICEPSASVCPMHEKSSCHSTPFPYKVAKSLSVEVFRNVEYDAWLEGKKEEQNLAYQDHLGSQSSAGNFTPGDKCQVILDGHGDHQFNAHVQEVRADSESAVVFVEELGERQVVQWAKMTPLPKIISLESSWKKRGKKKICECSRNVLVDGDSYMTAKSRPATHCQYIGRRMRINSAGLPIKVPTHDVFCNSAGNLHARQLGKTPNHVKEMFSTLGPRLKNPLRQRYNSEGHYSDELEARHYDDLVFCEQQDQKDTQTRPGVGDSNCEMTPQEWNSDEFREPEYADTADVVTAYRPLPDECGQGEASVPIKPINTTQHIQVDKILSPIQPSLSAVSTMVHAAPEMISSTVVQPMLGHPPGYFVVVPHPNIMIPISDNFTGPINTNVSLSAESNGQDLPLHDSATLGFFFNLGVQYYRSLLLVQQQSPQSAPPYYSYPTSNGAGMCMPQPGPVVAPEVYAVPESDLFTGASFCQAGLSQQSGTIYFSSPPQCPLPPFFQFGTASVQYQQTPPM